MKISAVSHRLDLTMKRCMNTSLRSGGDALNAMRQDAPAQCLRDEHSFFKSAIVASDIKFYVTNHLELVRSWCQLV